MFKGAELTPGRQLEVVYGSVRDLFRALAMLVFASAILPGAGLAQNCVAPPAGLVGWWRAEGNPNDIIGGNNGTLAGNASYGSGEVGQAFVFGQSGDGVLLTNTASLQLQDFTIETWTHRGNTAKASSSPGGAIIFGFGSGGYALGMNDNGQLFLTLLGASNVAPPGGFLTDTNWHHVAVTKVGPTVTFYVDGASYLAPAYGVVFQFSTPVGIGILANTLQNTYLGSIDELSVYNRALLGPEIQSIYGAGSAGKCFAPGPPTILTQPSNQSIAVGDTADLTVVAAGFGPFSYHWQLNGTNVFGATNATLVVINAQFTNAGNYAVVVSNPYGSVTSLIAQLTVILPTCFPPPSGLVSWWKGDGTPGDLTGGNNGSLAGNAGYGAGKVSEAFVFGGNGDGVVVGNPANLQLQDFTIEAWIQRASATQASPSPGGGSLFSHGSGGYVFGITDDGRMYVSVVDGSGIYANSLQVADTNWHHVALTISGTVALFYVDGIAYSAPPFTYGPFQFKQVAAIGIRADSLINGFIGSIDELTVYNRPLTATEILGIYNARSAGKCFTGLPPAISTQPLSLTVTLGNNAMMDVAVTGPGPYSYQWQLHGTNVIGATNATLIIRNAQLPNAGSYSAVITNPYGSVTSSTAQLAVIANPVCVPLVNGLVGWWPAEGTGSDAVGGNTSAFTGQVSFGPGKVGNAFVFGALGGGVIVTNSPVLQLQDLTIEAWVQRSNTNTASSTAGGGILFGYGSGGYAFGMSDDGRLYLTLIGGLGIYANSLQIADTVWHHLAVTKSGDAVVFYADGLAYSAVSFSTAPFQFASNAAIGIRPDTFGNGFIGSIDELAVYNRPLTAAEIVAVYNAGGAGKCLTGVPPAVTAQPSGQSAALGNNAFFSVTASGIGAVSYQWKLNGTSVAGATNSTLLVAGVQPSDAGNYTVEVRDAFGLTTSLGALLTVNPIVSIQPALGLVSWWPANGSAADVSGGNDGALTGQAGFIGGKVGLAFAFAGTGDGVVVGNPLNLQLQNFTIEAWIKRGSAAQASPSPGGGSLFSHGSGGYVFGITDDGRLYVSVVDGLGIYANSLQVADTNWHHVALTLSGTTAIFYADGIAYTAPPFTSGPFRFTQVAAIGIRADSFINGFIGLIDELSVYNRALAAAEIQAIYNASVAGKSRDNYLPPPRSGAQVGLDFTASTFRVDSSFIPPDANGTVGVSNFVEFINGRFSVFDKATGLRVQTMSGVQFWTGAGISFPAGVSVADPRLIYDASSGRWFASQVDFSGDPPAGGNHFLLAVSATSDPTGPWSAIEVIADPKTFAAADFPTLGIDANGVYLAADLFDSSGNRTGSTLSVFPKSALLGTRVTATGVHSLGPLTYSTRGNVLQPAVTVGASTGGEAVLSVGSLGDDFQPHANLWTFMVGNVTPTSAQNAALTFSRSINVPAYTIPINPPQPDGSTNLDDGDARFSAQVYRIGDVLYAAHGVELNQRAAIQWYLINALSGAVIQTGQITDPTLELFYPSIAANTNGTAVICFNGSSLGAFVSCYAAVGQTTNGVLGFGPFQLLKAGSANYQRVGSVDQRNRWGDYSATTVDPVNPSHFWTIQMYPSSPNIWSTQVTELITDPPAGPPPLTISSAGGMLAISWPASAAGYVLQLSSTFPNSDWAPVAQQPVRSGSVYVVTMPFPAAAGFFRLINP